MEHRNKSFLTKVELTKSKHPFKSYACNTYKNVQTNCIASFDGHRLKETSVITIIDIMNVQYVTNFILNVYFASWEVHNIVKSS